MDNFTKPDFSQPLDNLSQSIPVLNLKPDCIKSLDDELIIDCTNKTIIVFASDVSIQVNGSGYTLTWPAYKELGIQDIDSLTVIGTGEYIII